MLPEPPAAPIYTAPVLFGTRRRTQHVPAALAGVRATAGVRPCPTLSALLAGRGGDRPW
jgi:hypothetical protein